MASTHSSLHYHIVFSTKNCKPWFSDEFLPDLHGYLNGAINALGGFCHINGGIADHVHILTGLTPSHRISDFMRDIKSVSSGWVKEKLSRSKFAWQEGYGVFTVSPPDLPKVKSYIRNQAEHHRKKTFQEEYVEMLERGLVEHDEKYLW